MNTSDVERLLEVSTHVAAPPSVVWGLVHDVTGYSRWSPQVRSTRLRDGFTEVRLGAQFTNRNARGDLVWTTHAEVTEHEPERRLAFRILENHAVWSFDLLAQDDGTTLVHRRETPDGVSDLSARLTDDFMGGQTNFTRELLEGMRRTVEGIRTVAESRL